jgi:hypothetical protein
MVIVRQIHHVIPMILIETLHIHIIPLLPLFADRSDCRVKD